MTKRANLPVLADLPQGHRKFMQFDPSESVLKRYKAGLRMDAGGGENVINMLGPIGGPWWDSTAVMVGDVQKQLNGFGASAAVIVNMNSPGGDFFEGQAIYNLLRQHAGEVTVRVLGVAASAASVITMAGDKIEMPKASWLMIHNVWTVAMGDKHVLSAVIDDLEKFDDVSAELYAARSGQDVEDVVAMMDAETFLGGAEAVDKGFADSLMDDSKVVDDPKSPAQARQAIEQAFRKIGMSRSERRAIFSQLSTGTPRAADDGKSRAADLASLSGPLQELKQSIDRLQKSATELKG